MQLKFQIMPHLQSFRNCPNIFLLQNFEGKVRVILSWIIVHITYNPLLCTFNQSLCVHYPNRGYIIHCISFTENVPCAQMEVDIRNYDMHEVVMAPEGKFLYLKVPGLSENRWEQTDRHKFNRSSHMIWAVDLL